MLYHLLYPLSDVAGVFNVFRYITFRTGGAVVTALVLSIVMGPWLIATLRRLSVGQNIREVGPQSHLVKAGTPTMGGLLILFALTTATLLWANLTNLLVWLALGVTLVFGGIGFADDFIKVRQKRNLGLSARAKFLGLGVVSAAAAWALLSLPESYGFGADLTVPFFKQVSLDLGWFYVPFVMLVLAGASNAVNLTDGLDGLAIGSTLVAASTFA
ncbi:MAG: phospho-N-acetylmuramoyl-pentapeptide-transferase, partial [Holophagales bacterium]|nr:phospho-N-acetylmuramoyl-pentapeptide-transferase [Holophagales bacterium]